MVSKQNLVKSKFTYIDTFYHEGPTLIVTMHDLNVGLFEHFENTSLMEVDRRVDYTQHILRRADHKKYRDILFVCRQLAREFVRDEWNLGKLAELSVEAFWSWPNIDTMGYDGHPLLAWYKCVNFERELWFELEKFIWINHRSVYQYNMKYIYNDIVKPFKVKILHYSE